MILTSSPYSQAVQVEDSLFLAGQIGLIPALMVLPDKLEMEALTTLNNLRSVVDAMGYNLGKDVVNVVGFVSSPDLLEYAERIWKEYTGADCPCVIVAVSGLPRQANLEWHAFCGKGEVLSYKGKMPSSK